MAELGYPNEVEMQRRLGFNELQTLNIAFLTKMTTNTNVLWVQMLEGIYYPNNNFLYATKGGQAYWVWTWGRTNFPNTVCGQ